MKKAKSKVKPRYVIQSGIGLFGPFWTAGAATKWAHKTVAGDWTVRPVRPA